MKCGLIIGTYGSAPQIHLQLESARRFSPMIPLAVRDDSSPDAEKLRPLCERYGAQFITSDTRLGHQLGDLGVFVDGIKWAEENGIELLFKFSRRWIPLVSWLDGALALAVATGAPTLSGACAYYRFGFRTECMAMHIPDWRTTRAIQPVMDSIAARWTPLAEKTMHDAARLAWTNAGQTARAAEHKANGAGGYVLWPLLGKSRKSPRADVLWHEWAAPHEYLRALLQWGISDYTLEDIGFDP